MNGEATKSQICRGCMKVGGLLLSMYGGAMNDKKLPNKLADLASIKIDENDGMPNVLCPKCAYRTDVFYNFKLQVQESEKKLRKMFSKFSMNDSLIEALYNDLTDEKLVDNKCQLQYYGGIESTSGCIDNHLNDVFNNTNYGSDRMDESLDHDISIERFGESNNCIVKEENDRFSTASTSEFNSVVSESIGIVDSEVSNKYDNEIDSNSMEYMFLYDSPNIKGSNLKKEANDKQACRISASPGLKQIIIKRQQTGAHIKPGIDSTEKVIDEKTCQIVDNSTSKNEEMEKEEEKLRVGSEIRLNTEKTAGQSSEKNECSGTKAKRIEVDKSSRENINIKKNHDTDSDSDDYVNPEDNLLGSLNDTVVRIKEVKLENGSVQHQCTLCMQNYSELTGILIHTVDNHVPSTGPFYCIVCEKDCDSHKELRAHVKTHVGPNPYTCLICEKRYSTKRYLKRHIACHTDFPRHRCFKCGQRFKVKNDLDSHIKTHSQGVPYSCSQCPRTFNHKPNYRRHLISHIDPQGVRLPKFPCCICGKRFLNDRTLQAHLRVHTGEKPFECDICGRKFTQQGNLLNHVKIHANPRSFTCEICGKRFNQRATLRDHTMLHTGEKPFICTVCGVAFTVGAALRRHMFKHTDDKPFGCDLCAARFIGKYDLNRHMKTHNSKLARCKIRWKSDAFIDKDGVNDSDNDHDSDELTFPMISINELDDPDIIDTQTTPDSEQTVFIDQVLAEQNGIQMIVPQGESEKENVDALFNLMQYD